MASSTISNNAAETSNSHTQKPVVQGGHWGADFAQSTFELHQAAGLSAFTGDPSQLPYREESHEEFRHVLSIGLNQTIWVNINASTGDAESVAAGQPAVAALRAEPGPVANQLALVSLSDGILVNGVRPLPLAVIETKDLLRLGPQCLCYLTERTTPYVGTPTESMISGGAKCAFCRLKLDSTTRVITHRCGLIYHHETAESHPQIAENDRLNCVEKLAICLSCRKPIARDPYLVWHPSEIS